jgi:hypothetical protein
MRHVTLGGHVGRPRLSCQGGFNFLGKVESDAHDETRLLGLLFSLKQTRVLSRLSSRYRQPSRRQDSRSGWLDRQTLGLLLDKIQPVLRAGNVFEFAVRRKPLDSIP